MNNITIIGRITKDAELTDRKGYTFCNFTIADGDGRHTNFINCVTSQEVASSMKDFKKGDLIVASGTYMIENYTTNEGEKRQKHIIRVKNIKTELNNASL